jgi:SAM-dependent methyltransferase
VTDARAHWSRLRLTPSFEHYLEEAVGDVESVLDVGCGTNSPLDRFSRRFPRTVGVDLFAPAVDESKAKSIHDEYRVMDVLEIAEAFGPRSFDAVVAFDLVEHLSEPDALALFERMTTVARRRIVVFTPNGFLPQDAAPDNPYQAHRSGWTAEKMRDAGFEVRGINGLRWLRGWKGTMRWRPSRFWGLVSDLTQPVVYRAPSLAFHLLCTREIAAER